MAQRSDVSPSRGRILSSLSQIFKKKEPESKATPMMLGNDANFKYDPVKKRYIFLDEPEEQEEEIKPPPKVSQQATKQEAPKQQPVQEQSAASNLLAPPENRTLQRKKQQQQQGPRPNHSAPSSIPKPAEPQTFEQDVIRKQSSEDPAPIQTPYLTQESKEIKFNFQELKDSAIELKDDVREIPSVFQKNGENLELSFSARKESKNNSIDDYQKKLLATIQTIQIQMKTQKIDKPLSFLDFIENHFLPDESDFSNLSNQIAQVVNQWKSQNELDNLLYLESDGVNLKEFIKSRHNKESMVNKQVQGLQHDFVHVLFQLVQELMNQNYENQELVNELSNEVNNQDYVIKHQNILIADLISKLQEFTQYTEQLKPQIDYLKDEKQNFQRQKNQQINRIQELEIDLKNSRKETEIYQKQTQNLQKELDSYIRYYEEIRKEMQEDIQNLNTRLEESLNMSSTENQYALIENSQLKQQIEVLNADKKLMENTVQTQIQKLNLFQRDMVNLIDNDLGNIINLLNLPINFQIRIDANLVLEIRKIFFTIQKELTQGTHKKDSQSNKDTDQLKQQLQASNLKLKQMSLQMNNYVAQIKQNEKLLTDLSSVNKKSQTDKDFKFNQIVKENQLMQQKLLQLSTELTQTQKEVLNQATENQTLLSKLESILSMDSKNACQYNKQLEESIQQISTYLNSKQRDDAVISQLEQDKKNLQIYYDNVVKDQNNLKSQINNYQQQIQTQQTSIEKYHFSYNQQNEQLKEAEITMQQLYDQLKEQQNEKKSQEELILQLQNALYELTQEYSNLKNAFDQDILLKQQLENNISDLHQQIEQSKLNNEIQKKLEDNIKELTEQLEQQKQLDQTIVSLEESLQELTKQLQQQKQNSAEEMDKYIKESNEQYKILIEQEKEKVAKELQQQITDHQHQLSESLEKNKQLEDKAQQLQDENTSCQNLIEQLQDRLQQMLQKFQEDQQDRIQQEMDLKQVEDLKDQISKLQQYSNEQLLIKENERNQLENNFKEEIQQKDELISQLQSALEETANQLTQLLNEQQSSENKEDIQQKDKLIQELNTALQETSKQLNLVIQEQQQKWNEFEEKTILLNQEKDQIQQLLIQEQELTQRLSQQLEQSSNLVQTDDKAEDYMKIIEEQNILIQQLTEQLQGYQDNNLQQEIESLKNLYGQKLKTIEKLKQDLEQSQDLKQQLEKSIEENKYSAATIEEILREKTILLKQINEVQLQLDNNSIIQKNKELAQRITDIEEERVLLKSNLQEIITKMNEDVTALKTQLEETENQLMQVKAQRDDYKTQVDQINKEQSSKSESPVVQGGVLTKIAGFFVTESELKRMNQQQK